MFRGFLPLGMQVDVETNPKAKIWGRALLTYRSSGGLIPARQAMVDFYVPLDPDRETVLGGGRALGLEILAGIRLIRGRWTLRMWAEDEGSFPVEEVSQRIDPGTAGGIEFKGFLGRENQERVALTFIEKRIPSYGWRGQGVLPQAIKGHFKGELRLEGWVLPWRRAALGLMLFQRDHSHVNHPQEKGPVRLLWPQFRTGPRLGAVLALHYKMSSGPKVSLSGGVHQLAANGNDPDKRGEIWDDGLNAFFVSGGGDIQLSATMGTVARISWSQAKDRGLSPDAIAGERGRVRRSLGGQIVVYKIF